MIDLKQPSCDIIYSAKLLVIIGNSNAINRHLMKSNITDVRVCLQ